MNEITCLNKTINKRTCLYIFYIYIYISKIQKEIFKIYKFNLTNNFAAFD